MADKADVYRYPHLYIFAAMAEQLSIKSGLNRKESYEELFPQLISLTENEPDFIANLSNILAAIHHTFKFHWTGFYFVRTDGGREELVLGPFQGPVACTRIGKGLGVCGTAWEKKETIIVADVDQFPGHIACSELSRSEIVVPVIKGTSVIGVLDIDSSSLNEFSPTDKLYLEKIASLIAGFA